MTFDLLANRISISKAAKLAHKDRKVIQGAIERGEMRYIQFDGGKNKEVTAEFVAEWMANYCVHQNDPLPT